MAQDIQQRNLKFSQQAIDRDYAKHKHAQFWSKPEPKPTARFILPKLKAS